MRYVPRIEVSGWCGESLGRVYMKKINNINKIMNVKNSHQTIPTLPKSRKTGKKQGGFEKIRILTSILLSVCINLALLGDSSPCFAILGRV
jgi:hypothetical protein